MANSITNVGFSDYSAEQADIERRRAYAQALQQQGMLPQGETQMAGGWAIPNSPLSGLAKMLQAYGGRLGQEQATEQQKALAERYQSDYQRMVAKGLRELQGTPAEAGGAQDTGGGDIVQMPGRAAVPADPMAALATFGSHPQGAALAPLAMQQIQQQQRARMLAEILKRGENAQQPAQYDAASGSFKSAPQAGFGAGIPPQIMGLMTSGDPELVGLGKSLLEANKGIAQRPGAPVVNPFTGAVIAQPTPAVPAGVGLQVGPGGPQAYPVPGAIPAMAATTRATAAAGEAGKAPYDPGVVQTEGAPTLMTREQQIEAATGRPMPQPGVPVPQARPANFPVESPTERTGRMADRLSVLQREADEQMRTTGQVQPELQREITRTRQTPGLRLQDQGASAEQREMGKGLGEYSLKVQEAAANAAVGNRYLDNMEMAAKDIRLGKLAPAQSALTQWAQALNLPISEEAKKAAGSTQALTSMAIKMAGQATRQSDAQPSQLQYFKILESMPDHARTEDGFAKIVAYLRDANNYNIAKHQNLQQWRQAHNGTAEGFEAAWPAMAKELPFVWNQAANLKATAKSTPNPQAIVDELRRRGLVK